MKRKRRDERGGGGGGGGGSEFQSLRTHAKKRAQALTVFCGSVVEVATQLVTHH